MEQTHAQHTQPEPGEGTEDNMDIMEAELEDRVRQWLDTSGKRSELQAKIRAELYGALQTELAFRGDLEVVPKSDTKKVSKKEKLLNWLVSQHLTSNKHWLTNSVFVSEADIEPAHAQPTITCNVGSRSQLKQYDTEVVTKETVVNILTALGVNPDSELLKSVLRNLKEKSILCSIFDGLSSADVTRDSDGVRQPRRECSVPETMKIIEEKYDKIIDNFRAKRKETLLLDADEKCKNCASLEQMLIYQKDNHRRKHKKKPEDTDDIDDSSVSISVKDMKRKKTKSKESTSQREELEMLCFKMKDFMQEKEAEKSAVVAKDLKIKGYEEEISKLKDQLKNTEESFRRKQYKDNLENLNKIIASQNEKIVQQNTELLKMKNIIEISTMKESVSKSSENTKSMKEENTTKDTPTVDFFENIKNKLTSLEKEEKLIDNDFDDISDLSNE